MRTALALALLLVALAPAAAQDDAAQPYVALDGVTYYFAAGRVGSANLALEPAAEPTTPFQGCAFAQLRPETGNGRVSVLGLVGPASERQPFLDATFATFESPDGKHPGIDLNTTLDGRLDHDARAHPAVLAQAAGWGLVGLRVDGHDLADPVSDKELRGSFTVTPNGYRDDASGDARPPAEEAGDAEFHVRFGSPVGAAPTTHTVGAVSPAELPAGLMAPNTAHEHVVTFNNTKFGGQGTLRATARATAAPGQNDILVRVIAPGGAEVANATLQPSLLADAEGEATFPLDRFGAYALAISGEVALSAYEVQVEMAPPKAFTMGLWWEDVAYGQDARAAYQECIQQVGSPNGVVAAGTSVGRQDPPGFPLELVVLAVLAAVAVVLVAAKLASETFASGATKRWSRK